MRSESNPSTDPVVKVVDLFCGAGGLSYGLKSAGLTIAAGVDLDAACEHPFARNCGGEFARRSVTELTSAELDGWFSGADVRVLAGCAPCQPFSSYSQSRKTPDQRWQLLRSFQRLALASRPEVVAMENVAGLARNTVWTEFVSSLESAGYRVHWAEVRVDRFGVPQTRKRLIAIASLIGAIELVPMEGVRAPTVREAIADLPPIAAGEAHAADALHCASSLSPRNLERIRLSRPGGTWRDWPEEVRSRCHVRETGETYPSVYGRMAWDEPAPTITTQCFGFGNGRFGHPVQDRAISLREAAILQSFPRDYSFVREGGRMTFAKVGMLIGNAVPPKLGEAIGQAIMERVRANAAVPERRRA